MPETVSRAARAGASTPTAADTPACSTVLPVSVPRPHRFGGRIGVGLAGGFYPAPHRYRLYLTAGCPRSRRVSVVLGLLGLTDSLGTTLLGPPAETPDAFASLRGAYEATWHRYDGPLTAPALCDRWSGRVVSNHTPDILRDLAGLLTDADGTCRPALARLDRQLAFRPYALGGELSTADLDLWVTLTHLAHFDAAHILSPYRHLEAYVRRLDRHPAVGGGDRAQG